MRAWGHHVYFFWGRSSIPWCCLCNEYFDVSCPVLIGLSALQIALGTLDCSSGGSHGYGKQEHVPVEDTAWPPARRPDPIYAADCGEGMQTYPTEGMERRCWAHASTSSGAEGWCCSQQLVIEITYPKSHLLRWCFPLAPVFSRDNPFSAFLLKPVHPWRCSSEARLCLFSLYKKKIGTFHTLNTSQSCFIHISFIGLSSN